MNALFSGILVIALSNSTPITYDENSFIAGYSVYAEANYAQTHKIWTQLANQNDARAQYGLAVMYEFGQGVPHDYTQAAYWYKRAAKLDYAMAKNNLGMLYEKGLGVPPSLDMAIDYYRQAAEQGLASSQYNMGLMHYDGIGVKQDATQAWSWFYKAALQDFAPAQYNLGLMYQRGDGTETNHVEAARWYIQAINTGASKAYSGLQALLRDKEAAPTAQQLILRQQPNASADIISQIPSGDLVYTLDRKENWVAILTQDQKTLGWVELPASQ